MLPVSWVTYPYLNSNNFATSAEVCALLSAILVYPFIHYVCHTAVIQVSKASVLEIFVGSKLKSK